MRRLAGILIWLALVFAAPAWATPHFPPLTGRVVDDAHVLSPQTQADLTTKLAALEQKTSRQLVVVTLPSLDGYEIEDYGYQLGRAWGIGQKGTNNGVLFIIVPSEHKLRIEVGYGLEPVLTDALSSQIEQETIIPKFRGGDIEGGIVAGTDALIDQLSLDPSAAEAKAAQTAQAAQAAQDQPMGAGGVILLIIAIIFLVIIFALLSRIPGVGWILSMIFFSGGGGGGGWGGGGGGGGFSGGGGSFGGGGASGSW